MTQQGSRQASVEALTGTALDYNGDWNALFDQAGIPAGDFNGRMLTWINQTLSQAYAEIDGALQALATASGAYNFASLGTIGVAGAPSNTVAPAITGIQTEGQTLTVSNGTWTGAAGITYAYQWNRAGVPISAATAATYVLQAADVGQAITCTVTATNASGSAVAVSNAITPAAVLSISGAPGTVATVGAAYSFTPATAGGHTPKTWSIANKPAWAAFSTSTGQLTGTPAAPETDAGIVITVTDVDGLTASLASFTITVANAPGSNFSFPLLLMGYF